MIRYFQYRQLDKERYDQCIADSEYSRVYAYSWFLDLVCAKWDALVLDEYEAVMPIPRMNKYGFPIVYTPNWVQQLGVFSGMELPEDLLLDFLRAIPRKFLKIDYRMNSGNRLKMNTVSVRQNYLLDLHRPYDELLKNFKKNRRISASLSDERYLVNKHVRAEVFRQFLLGVEKPFDLNKSSFNGLMALISSGRKEFNIWSVELDGSILAALFWIEDNRRITCLLPLSSRSGKEAKLPTFLICELIRSFQNSRLVLDFEGSMVPGVAQYYKSFGARQEDYYVYRKRFYSHA